MVLGKCVSVSPEDTNAGSPEVVTDVTGTVGLTEGSSGKVVPVVRMGSVSPDDTDDGSPEVPKRVVVLPSSVKTEVASIGVVGLLPRLLSRVVSALLVTSGPVGVGTITGEEGITSGDVAPPSSTSGVEVEDVGASGAKVVAFSGLVVVVESMGEVNMGDEGGGGGVGVNCDER